MTDQPQWLRKALRTMLRLREDALDEAIVAAVDDLRRDPTGAIVGGGHDALRASLRAVLGAGDIADAELIALVGDLRRAMASEARDGADLRHLRAALRDVLGVSNGMFDDELVARIRRDIRDRATLCADEEGDHDRAIAMLSTHGLPPGLTLSEMIACLLDRIDR